jgi:hypothetical protein
MSSPTESVTCPLCAAGPWMPCRMPSGDLAKRAHRVRVVLSIVGDRSSEAAATVERLLCEGLRRSDAARGPRGPR